KVSFKLPKAVFSGLLIMGTAIGTAHSELVIQEKDPSSSVINQFAKLKNADARSPQLHQLVSDLNHRLSVNPNDSLAWEILAQIYYNNGYTAYAVYTASEAINLGHSTAKLKKILLNSSAIVSQKQLQSDYLTDEVDADFLKEYQHALSKIYGEIYGFNYDESLPKPPAPVIKPRAVKNKTKSRKQRRTSVKKKASPVKRQAAVKQRRAPTKPVKKQSPSKSSLSIATDPFKNVRSK
ncbi:hypothetical protein ACS8FD_19845, partial [Psychrobacter sp. 1U2]|uniref:hypothetical protein n=2 Tax=unclassified Psychrobacter TaxID=196806 RepID=UPI003F45F3C9